MPLNTFTNEEIDFNSLPKFEEITLKKPHHDYWKIICLNFLWYFLFFGVAIGLGINFIDDFKQNAVLISSCFIAFIMILFFLYRISFKRRGYAIRTKDVVYKSGVIAESTTIVPLNRIQHIELNEGFWARFFKLASLQIFTAGGQTGHLKIAGIPIDEAKSIRDLLLQKLDLIEESQAETES